MKARIYHDNPAYPHYVTVEADNWAAEYDDNAPARVSTTYFCPVDGGYVRIADDAGRHPQVCEGLASMGNTLYCRDPATLIDLIRRERRKALAADRRQNQC